jgi:acetate kinase
MRPVTRRSLVSKHASSTGTGPALLAINGGSSSLKFASFSADSTLERLAAGSMHHTPGAGAPPVDWLAQQVDFRGVVATGHRIVLSADRPPGEPVTAALIELLREACTQDPDHLPAQLALIEAIAERYPGLPQFVCHDAAFHATMPPVARMLPIPRRFVVSGIQRYGFHGLSCSYLMQALAQVGGIDEADGRVILAHLGGGASLTAVHHGLSVDTSMGYTPAGGVIMGTRPGDLDPGLALALMQHDNLTAAAFDAMINRDSGLIGVSGTTGDMRELLARQTDDPHAAAAVSLFCYQVRKWVGAFTAVLGGVDTLVFSGGIGENVPEIRARSCQNLGFLGIEIDAERNAANAPIISRGESGTTVRVIATDEERMIAQAVWKEIGEKP